MKLWILILFFVSNVALASSYNGFDLSNSLINKKLIVQGGPPRDGIPAIFNPDYVSANQADFMKADDIVLGFKIANQVFADPRHILNWHEIVNDQVADQSFVITYCPLCGSGLAFSSHVKNKQLEFGVSGLLYNNDLIFYDKQTESLWSQIEKRSISGELVGENIEQLALEHTTWENWKKKNPDTKVLSENQGFKRNYRHDPYTGYDTSSQVFFKTLRKTPSDYHTKEKVLGVVIGDKAKAYPFSELNKHGLDSFVENLSGVSYKVIWNESAQSASIESLDDDVIPTVAYWFAWYNFHPETEVFKAQK